MRNTTHDFLREIITAATAQFLQKNLVPPDEPLELYADEIFRITLMLCAQHFLANKGLRTSENNALTELQKDLREKIDITIIERHLIDNLKMIKPTWGEFFGTDRGKVYNTFIALKEWPCFTWHARLYYQQQRHKKLNTQTHSQSQLIHQHQQQLDNANQLIQRQEKTTETLSQRAALQFITIQQLQLELKQAKAKINALENETILPTLPKHIDF